MPMVLCKRYLLEAQRYKVDGYDILQDNQSEIILDKNEGTSSS